MTEIEQSALDALTAKAGEVDGLNTEITTLKGQVTTLEEVTTERDALKTEKSTFVATQTDLEGKLSSATTQVTTLTTQAEGHAGQVTKLTEAETKIKELEEKALGLETKITVGLKARLTASGLTEDNLKDKDTVVLEAMEVAAIASRTAANATTTKEAGLGGAPGGAPSKPANVLEQAESEMAKLRSTPALQGPPNGNIQE